MAKIYFLFSLFFLCLFSQSCTGGSDAGSTGGSNNVVPTSTPTPVPTPTYGTWRMPITLTEKSGNALTDYQVCIDLSNDNIIYSHFLDASGDDLRFFVNSTECSYWIQTWKNGTGSKSQIWVKIPGLAANGTTTLEMRYGDASATARSDGNATMLLYDHFTDSTTDLTKWTDYSAAALTTNAPKPYIFQSPNPPGIMQLYNTNNIAPKLRGFILSKNQLTNNIAVDAYFKVGATSKGYFEGYLYCDGGTHTSAAVAPWDAPPNTYNFSWQLPSGTLQINKITSGTLATLTTMTLAGNNSWHTISMQYFNQQLKLRLDDVQQLSTTDTGAAFSTNYIGVATRSSDLYSAGTIVSLDWVTARKLVMPEPTVTLGAEQSYP